MGSTFSLLFAHAPLQPVASAVLALAEAEGYEPIDPKRTTPARSVFVRSGGTREWAAVDDELLYAADAGTLGQWASRLSARLSVPVVAAGVVDSDIATLVLAVDGRASQAVELGPAVEGGPPEPSPEWLTATLPGRTAEELARAWRQPVVFAEQALINMAPLFGWDEGLAARGEWSRQRDRGDIEERVFHLCLASTTTPGMPPAFGHAGGDHEVHAGIGETSGLTAVAHSTGGPGTGLSVTVWGPALDAGFVVARRATVTVAQPPANAVGQLEASSGSERFVTASFTDLAVPPGLADQRAAFAGVSNTEGVKRWLATRIEAVIELEATQVGRADLHIALVPQQNRDGAAVWSAEVAVS